MRYFLPDSQDLVDPSFDFDREGRSPDRVRHRDDTYAHEVFSSRAYDGLLVSKGIVDGYGSSTSKYTLAQRHRLLRLGAKEFLRIRDRGLPVMGDCGAFTYVREPVPPYSVEEVLDFYEECQFDYGMSVDHVILQYQPKWDALEGTPDGVPMEVRDRRETTLQLAAEFLEKLRARRLPLVPLGVAQGWSPRSYSESVEALQRMGFSNIALGGLVPLKTAEILACLDAVSSVRRPETQLHLLGVTRIEHVTTFAAFGVASFDSTSPLMQAFKDEKDNYYTADRAYTAIRVPQVEGNPKLTKRIKSGEVSQDTARNLEKRCLAALKHYDADQVGLEEALEAVLAYDAFCEPKGNRASVHAAYREVLTARPWRDCPCDICQRLGYHVILFRGAERNRRRGFHNIWVFYRRLHRELGIPLAEIAATTSLGRHSH